MGSLVTVVVVMPALFDGVGIGLAAAIGAVLAVPVACLVARAIRGKISA